MALEWDFTLPCEAVSIRSVGPCAFGTHPDSWAFACGKPGVYQAEGSWWCSDHGPLSPLQFRPVPSIGDAMVFCVGCGDPMSLDASLTHTCDIPPAGRL
jgi:hypothetical protein